ncbi:MAG: hypothetical protein Q9203_000722, partial [Teloschistes exilis]
IKHHSIAVPIVEIPPTTIGIVHTFHLYDGRIDSSVRRSSEDRSLHRRPYIPPQPQEIRRARGTTRHQKRCGLIRSTADEILPASPHEPQYPLRRQPVRRTVIGWEALGQRNVARPCRSFPVQFDDGIVPVPSPETRSPSRLEHCARASYDVKVGRHDSLLPDRCDVHGREAREFCMVELQEIIVIWERDLSAPARPHAFPVVLSALIKRR